MNKGYLTIESVLSVLALLLILEMIGVITQLRYKDHYQFLEGSSTCDINCLLTQE